MLAAADQVYIDRIRAQLASLPAIIDHTVQHQPIRPLVEKFDAIISHLRELSQEESKPEAIRTFSHVLYASIQRDMERILRESRISEYAAKAECIISMYRSTLSSEKADESEQRETA